MERRIPSSSISEHIPYSLRRRSSNYSSRSSKNEDVGLSPAQHTVLLVERLLPSQPSCILPFAAIAEEHLARHNEPGEQESLLEAQLTLRPNPPHFDSDDSVQTTNTRYSQIPRLPTPDFGYAQAEPTETQVNSRSTKPRSYLPRGLSFVSFHLRPAVLFSSTPASSRPQSVRTESSDSSASERSTGASSPTMVDLGHNVIIPAFGTTAKFTHKWPRPQSLKYVKGDDDKTITTLLQGQSLSTILEAGQGPEIATICRWNLFKWALLVSVLTVFSYGAAGLVCAIMTWFRTWQHADVFYVADNDILILITLAASVLTFTSLIGISGVFLNSRPILATYAILLWPALTSLLVVGYISYRRATFALDHKLNLAWSQYYTSVGRLLIQNSLQCCGYYNPLHESTPSKYCYSRTSLPGCKSKLYLFESENLQVIWSAAFALVPLHLLNIIIALLCANHLTKNFGAGMTPKQYRLCSADVQADAEKIMQGMRQVGLKAGTRPSADIILEDDRENHPCQDNTR